MTNILLVVIIINFADDIVPGLTKQEQIMKTFLSIGIGPGIGFATAERFAREGFRVVLAARNEARVNELVKRLTDKGYEAVGRTVDAANPEAVTALVRGTEADFDGLDVLHYNAARLHQATLQQQAADTFNMDLAVNIGGAMTASQAALNVMAARTTGTILITGGGWGIYPNPDFISVSVGKAGTRALALGLFEPARTVGVHVGTVTVATLVQPESAEAAGIAQAFWELYAQPVSDWTAESVFQG